MKPFIACLLAIAATCLIGACDSHPWSETKGLHEKYQEHATEHKAEAGHEAAVEKK